MTTAAQPANQGLPQLPPKRLYFSRNVWEKMWSLTAACDIEISGLGIMAADDPNFVEELYILPQVCTGVRTSITPDAVTELTMNLRAMGIAPSRMRFWWHSHVNMGTTFSGTDDDNIRRYGSDFLWSVCTNKNDAKRVRAGLLPLELNIRCDTFDPGDATSVYSPLRTTHTNCVWGLDYPQEEFDEEWAKEVVAKCVTKQPVAQTTTTYYGSSAHGKAPYAQQQPYTSPTYTAPAQTPPANKQLQHEPDRLFEDDAVEALYQTGFLSRGEGHLAMMKMRNAADGPVGALRKEGKLVQGQGVDATGKRADRQYVHAALVKYITHEVLTTLRSANTKQAALDFLRVYGEVCGVPAEDASDGTSIPLNAVLDLAAALEFGDIDEGQLVIALDEGTVWELLGGLQAKDSAPAAQEGA